MRTKCPACGKELDAPDNVVGKKAKCPKCGQSFEILPLESKSLTVPVGAGGASIVVKPVGRDGIDGRRDRPIEVTIVDINIPFRSVAKLVFQWLAASFVIGLALSAIVWSAAMILAKLALLGRGD